MRKKTNEATLTAFATNLNHLLTTHKVSKYKLAKYLKINTHSVYQFTSAKSLPSVDTLQLIAKAFNTTIDKLLA